MMHNKSLWPGLGSGVGLNTQGGEARVKQICNQVKLQQDCQTKQEAIIM